MEKGIAVRLPPRGLPSVRDEEVVEGKHHLNPAGVLPRWIQGIRRVNGVGEEKLIYLIRNIKRLGRNSIALKFSGEKRLNNLVYVESQ